MRLVCFVFGLVVLAVGSAGAGTSRVVVMTDTGGESLRSALRVALGGKHVVVASAISPRGALRLDRAAIAQHEAIAARADAAVWIDAEGDVVEVCVVSADGRHFRHAPLPAGDTSPRVFAAIATSLLDELVAPPEGEPTINVDVHVSVGRKGVEVTTSPNTQVVVDDPVGTRRPGATAPPADPVLAPPGATSITPSGATAAVAASAPAPTGRMRADRTLVEIGPMLSPVSAGVEGELMFPASPSWRIGVMGIANIVFVDDNQPLFAGAAEIRHIGSGRRRHFDVGVLGGAATAEGDTVGMAALRLQVTWENQSRATALALLPCVLFAEGEVMPGVWASLRWGLAI